MMGSLKSILAFQVEIQSREVAYCLSRIHRDIVSRNGTFYRSGWLLK
jgi:hypothetical protein